MKIITASLLVLSLASGCDNNNSTIVPKEFEGSQKCFEVSYVTGICSQAILKIENPNFFSYGENWGTYSNVFFTVFDCGVDESKLMQSKFYVSIIDKPEDSSCVRCLAALDYKGTKKYHLKVFSKCE